ncbi:cerebroside-sulfatase [Lutibacter sp. HS1-25]|uniref:sulfatase family protein n=1 Tax=Lutibacter sp. HS1-25 TaxID=2485000 RepID=UPI001012E8FB|nr:sulfatase [Lutibacter sp. HS1-25]RXP62693.1 cerebroside-sulfatase [Lutibacter sp. HS1-25]
MKQLILGFVYFLTIITFKINAQLIANQKPNVIIIFTDDQGYQDLGCFGSPKIKTPNLDKMAQDGIRFTDFYVSNSVCSASRAALLTGRYSYRNGVGGVFFPDAKGMDTNEITIAEVLKPAGYKTACFGKWHLGDFEENLPTSQGFDTYFGIPYSNDMYIGATQKFSKNVVFKNGYTLEKAKQDQLFVKNNSKDKIKQRGIKELSPLFLNNEIIEYPCDQTTLTKRYFNKAIDFIDQAKDSPFFLYITPAMPHVPLYASKKFKGTSDRGLYGDVIEEIDFYVGNLLQHLKEKGLDKNTLVIFASDNGPWLGYKELAGSALPLRDGKFTNYEGGVRVPCIMYWPGKIESGKTSNAIVSTVDFLPTIAHYATAQLPNIPIDGVNIANLIESGKDLNRDCKLYLNGTEIFGIRKGDWKYLPFSGNRNADSTKKPELFNLKSDISEATNLYDKYPEIVKELSAEMEKFKK